MSCSIMTSHWLLFIIRDPLFPDKEQIFLNVEILSSVSNEYAYQIW